MSRKFQTADYEATLNSTVTLREWLPPDHLARFIVDVITHLDLSALYAHYSPRGGEAIAPEILLGLLFYGYATGTFSSRKIERATYESMPFHFLAGGLHPDHDTIANFRKTFLQELKDLFVHILLYAQELGVLPLGNISLDGTKIHADASKGSAISYKRLLALDSQLHMEVDTLFALTEHAEQTEIPEGLVIADAIAFRHERLVNLAKAKAVLETRAQERYEAEQAAYDAKVHERAAKARQTGSNPRGRPPTPPTPGPRDKDQYNFTDPESRIMKNSNNDGFDQHDNAQAAVEQDSFLMVANTLSNHPNDQAEAIPTLDAIPLALGKPKAGALDNGYFSATNIAAMEARDIEPYIATGRTPHHPSWLAYFAQQPTLPPADASPKVHMAYKLQTEIGGAIYRLRKCTVEPVLGIIKDSLGFRQCSLRGLWAAAGEWCLVCLAFNLKRLHTLTMG
jgi:transposase